MADKRHAKRRPAPKRSKTPYAALAVAVGLVTLVLLLPPSQSPMQCFPNDRPDKLGFDTRMFIWVGTERGYSADMIRIDPNIGQSSGCEWPITTGDDTSAERGTNYTTVHIRSPVVHEYTLGNFFDIWGYSRGGPVYFGPDGVSGERGPTTVSYNYGPYVPADRSMVFHPGDRIDVQVIPQG